jgi:uncharacterized protein YggE
MPIRSMVCVPIASLALVLATVTAPPLGAQWAARPADQPRQVVVSATETVDVAPDRARVVIAVETRGRTSAAVASENARIQAAVLAAVREAGVAPAQIRTLVVSVNPEYRYPAEGGRPTVVGYQARNSIRVELHDLAKVAATIDGALAAGATNVNGPELYLADPDAARREALQKAVKKARAEAEAMAEAAGVTLGAILELSASEGGDGPVPVFAMARARADESAATPVQPGNITVSATVNLRIALVQR